MRKSINKSIQRLTIVSLSLLFSNILLSQNGNGNGNGNGQQNNQWKITGNVTDTNNFIGTTNLREIKFKTNNVEHLRLTKEGDLGLGTSLPAAKLDVFGNVILRNVLQLPNTPSTNTFSNKYFLIIDSLGNVNKTPIGSYPPWNPILTTCDFVNPDGSIGVLNPYWASGLNKLYSQCPSVNVGIATTTPRVNLDVLGQAYMGRLSLGKADPLASAAYFHLKAQQSPSSIVKMMFIESNEQELLSLDYQGLLATKNINAQKIVINAPDNNESPFVIETSNQKLLQLDYDGLLHARRIRIDAVSWADFVFDKKYELLPLLDLKKFITLNKHLPNIPTEQIVISEGVDIIEMNKLLLQKVEELTLYVIELNDEVIKLKNQKK